MHPRIKFEPEVFGFSPNPQHFKIIRKLEGYLLTLDTEVWALVVFSRRIGVATLANLLIPLVSPSFLIEKEMKPILPREMLWKDKGTMMDFFRIDPVNADLFEVFLELNEESFDRMLEATDVFNEVYYQITRMIYDHPMPKDLPKYIADIKANLGWNFSAELVMSMAYFLISLIDRKKLTLNRIFIKTMCEKFSKCQYWKHFKHMYDELRKERTSVTYNFEPCPMDVDWFAKHYVHWKEITCNYDYNAITYVINLWKEQDEKSAIARMIQDSIVYSSSFLGQNIDHVEPLLKALTNYQVPEDSGFMVGEEKMEYDNRLSEIIQLKSDRDSLQKKLSFLESENERLKSLLESKKRTGASRKFTLVQIVDYCKGCIDWDDAKIIVAMLNKLLRRVATEEESDLVDSIEEEFLNRRYGNTYVKEQNVFPNVGNYKPEINNQNLNVPISPMEQNNQKLLGNE